MPTRFYLPEDFDDSLLKFNPNRASFFRDIRAEIPAFASFGHEAANNDSTKMRVFAWIVIMYDPNTPLRREIKDLYKRKVYAASICGFAPNALTGKYKKYVEKFLLGQDPKVNFLIVQFISYFASPEYTQLMGHVTLQHNALEKIIAGEGNKETQGLLDLATDKVKELTNVLFGTGQRDEVFEARSALYKQVSHDLSEMRAENVAKMYSSPQGLPAEWSPYGEEYKPNEVKFAGDDPKIAEKDEE